MIFVDIVVVKVKFNILMIDCVHERFMTLRVLRSARKSDMSGLKPPTCAVTVNKLHTSAALIRRAEVFKRQRICRCVATSSARFLYEERLGHDAPLRPCAPPRPPARSRLDTAQLRFDSVRVPQRYRLGHEGAGFK